MNKLYINRQISELPVLDIEHVVREINKYRLAVFSVDETRRRIKLKKIGMHDGSLTDRVKKNKAN